MFKVLLNSLIIALSNSQYILPGSQVDVTGHGCIVDGGYEWCEELQTCIRPWENECNSQIVTEPGPVVDPRPVVDPVPNCLDNCPPPMPCPMPEMNIDVSSCKLKYHVDDCGCQAACPSYDCNDNVVTIPSNCATWMDGCNTCQVRNGRAEICTLMYCFRQGTPHCLNYHIQENTLNIEDVCYRFCEDGSQESVNRRSDCPSGTTCTDPLKNTDIMSFDSCGNRAWTCRSDSH